MKRNFKPLYVFYNFMRTFENGHILLKVFVKKKNEK